MLDIRPVFRMLLMRRGKEITSIYYFWLKTSPIGIKRLNDHGTPHDVPITFVLSFLGREEEARVHSKQEDQCGDLTNRGTTFGNSKDVKLTLFPIQPTSLVSIDRKSRSLRLR